MLNVCFPKEFLVSTKWKKNAQLVISKAFEVKGKKNPFFFYHFTEYFETCSFFNTVLTMFAQR